ncbi:hypothetical protein GCM10023148_29240 [Actinokineospora soli]
MTRADVADTEPRFDERQPPAPDDLFDADDEAEPADVGAFSAVDPRVAEALRYAGRELRSGVCETGTNGGIPLSRYVHWFNPGLGPVPWCAFFISWCWDNATDRNRRTPWDNPGYVPSVHAWARTHGKLVTRPRQGDLFGVGGDHIGWVLTAGGSDFTTIEGNAPTCVRSIRRGTSGMWFARIA